MKTQDELTQAQWAAFVFGYRLAQSKVRSDLLDIAERWTKEMEGELERGKTIEECALECLHRAIPERTIQLGDLTKLLALVGQWWFKGDEVKKLAESGKLWNQPA